MADTQFAAFLAEQSKDNGRNSAAQNSLNQLAENGLPNKRVEAYKYTDLRALFADAPSSFNPKPENMAGLIHLATKKALAPEGVIVFAHGQCITQESLPEGVTLASITDAPLPAINQDSGEDALFQLCGALPMLCHEVTVNTDKLVEIILASEDSEAVIATRLKINIAENIEHGQVMITHLGGAGATCLSFVEIAQDKGQFTLIKRQLNAKSAQHFDIMAFAFSGDATGAIYQLNSGASQGRNGIYGTFKGEETASHLDLYGVTLAGGKDHMDTTFVLDHAVPNCTSQESFKNVVGGSGKAVFQGKIMVKQIAQKTDAQMMCQSLLVSENAEVDVKPELEIFADDVQCGHGATMGDIDEDLLFYLRARGIPSDQARKLLMLAFLSEVFENLEDEALIHLLQQDIEAGLDHVM